MNGAAAIADILKREGTEFIACYPNQPLIEACAVQGIRPIMCRQERVGMAIADGFSRTTNGKRIGVFTCQWGPGAENSFPGAAQAFADNVPVLLLPGGEATTKHHIRPNFSASDSYRTVTKWLAEVNAPTRVPELMRRAFYHLRTGKGGPVLVEVPLTTLMGEYPGPIEYTPVKGNKFGPSTAEVKEVAKALLGAKSLLIHAGQGVLYAEATDELVELAELLQAPVMTTMPGKSGFPENHPLSLGACSISTPKPVAHFLGKADMVFGIGTSFTQTVYGKKIPPGKVMVHATNDPGDINKDYRADYALVGDAKLTLQALVAEVKAQSKGMGNRTNGDTAKQVQAVKADYIKEWMPHFTSSETPINPYRIIWDLMHTVDRKNTIITHDAGSPRDHLVPFWETVAPRTYQGWGKSTQLGYGLGITMGAKLAEPQKLCINLMGDASIGMVGMDIETAARSKLGILTIILNNGAMAIERRSMPIATEKYGSVFLGGNYRDVAKALGGWAERVEKPDAFIPALKRAIDVTRQGQPAMLECITKECYDFPRYQ